MTEQNLKNKILIVEDDIDLRNSLTAYLTTAGLEVTGVGSCLECYATLANSNFSVALVDVTLPDQSGFVLAEYLRTNTSVKIIILTALERIDDRVRGYSAGAHNYFVKPVDTRELLAAIISLVAIGYQDNLPDAAMSGQAWQLQRNSWHLVTPNGQAILLTALELQLVEIMAVSPYRVVSRNSLLTSIYSRVDEHSGRALDSLVRRLRAKITACDCLSPIKTAHSVGYCFSAPITIS
jgi:DNA-binding response OmpR family regulator